MYERQEEYSCRSRCRANRLADEGRDGAGQDHGADDGDHRGVDGVRIVDGGKDRAGAVHGGHGVSFVLRRKCLSS
jgi:hypothetical protein